AQAGRRHLRQPREAPAAARLWLLPGIHCDNAWCQGPRAAAHRGWKRRRVLLHGRPLPVVQESAGIVGKLLQRLQDPSRSGVYRVSRDAEVLDAAHSGGLSVRTLSLRGVRTKDELLER